MQSGQCDTQLLVYNQNYQACEKLEDVTYNQQKYLAIETDPQAIP